MRDSGDGPSLTVPTMSLFIVPAMHVAIQIVLSLFTLGHTRGFVRYSGDVASHTVPTKSLFIVPAMHVVIQAVWLFSCVVVLHTVPIYVVSRCLSSWTRSGPWWEADDTTYVLLVEFDFCIGAEYHVTAAYCLLGRELFSMEGCKCFECDRSVPGCCV